MENASKALLIAGAILIVILLIGVGMMVYQGAMGTIGQGISSMNQQEKDAFNQQFTQYEGVNVKGSNVRAVISNISSNNQTNIGVPEKCVGLDLSKANISGVTPNKWEPKTDASDEIMNQMSAARARVNSSAIFTVTCQYDSKTGLVNNVIVEVPSTTK